MSSQHGKKRGVLGAANSRDISAPQTRQSLQQSLVEQYRERATQEVERASHVDIAQQLVDIVPQNPFAALAQTQAAQELLTQTATPTATGLPDTGFADDVGAPTLLAMAGLLILVIFVARRLRASTA